MIGDSGDRDHDLVTVDTLATTLALTTSTSFEDLGLDTAQDVARHLRLRGSATVESVVSKGRMNKRTEHILLIEKSTSAPCK